MVLYHLSYAAEQWSADTGRSVNKEHFSTGSDIVVEKTEAETWRILRL